MIVSQQAARPSAGCADRLTPTCARGAHPSPSCSERVRPFTGCVQCTAQRLGTGPAAEHCAPAAMTAVTRRQRARHRSAESPRGRDARRDVLSPTRQRRQPASARPQRQKWEPFARRPAGSLAPARRGNDTVAAPAADRRLSERRAARSQAPGAELRRRAPPDGTGDNQHAANGSEADPQQSRLGVRGKGSCNKVCNIYLRSNYLSLDMTTPVKALMEM